MNNADLSKNSRHDNTILFQQCFQLLDESRFKHMLDQIRFTVDAAGGDVREMNQIEFPQSMNLISYQASRDISNKSNGSTLIIQIH